MIKQYELSIWEDYMPDGSTDFQEQKLVVIGGDSYNAPQHAYNIKEQRSMNGDRTLSFNMLGKYINESGELVDNPYWSLLVNERKLKLRDGAEYDFSTDLHELTEEDSDNRWRDYIIKTINEESANYVYSYTAKEQYVNELGKNGWSVNLNTELNNNLGTLQELADKILENSGWTASVEETVLEKVPMPLFRATLSGGISATQITTGTTLELFSGTVIYLLYSCVKRNAAGTTWELDKSNPIQFLYKSTGFVETDIDDNRLIIDDNSLYNYEIAASLINTSTPAMTSDIGSSAIRGNFIVKKQDITFDTDLNRYVLKYTVSSPSLVGPGVAGLPLDTPVFGYKETVFTTPTLVKNYLTNSSNFINNTAWFCSRSTIPEPFVYPKITSQDSTTWANTKLFNYLRFNFRTANTMYLNEGPQNAKMELVKGNRYVVRVRGRMINSAGTAVSGIQDAVHVSVGSYKNGTFSRLSNYAFINLAPGQLIGSGNIEEGYPLKAETRAAYTSGDVGPFIDEQGYVYVYLTADQSTRADMQDINLRLYNNTAFDPIRDYDYAIEDIQLFNLVLDSNNKPIFPDDIPQAETIERYRFYYKDTGVIKDLARNISYYKPVYKDSYNAIRQINVQNSNYFNNTSTLAELFEVWVSYRVKHQKNGYIYKVNGKPIKTVYFSQFAPTNLPVNYAGFKYGINLNSMTRNRDSSQMASRIIVQDNKQQFAKNGTATIKRAINNPSLDNEIFNFDYYINHNLLSLTQVLRDLYGTVSSDFSYYPRIRKLNEEFYTISAQNLDYNFEISVAKSEKEYAEEAINSATEEINYQNMRYNTIPAEDLSYREPIKANILNLIAQKQAFEKSLASASARIADYQTRVDSTKTRMTAILAEKSAIKKEFYEKYNRFIQEGTWVDESYIDDDLYYLDAYKLASVSAFPKTSYNINVADISNIEGYEPYRFEIGTKTYIEDTEFFGWTNKIVDSQSIKTPFRMEAIVSEQTYDYGDPSKSTLVIQTYKNQYQDLFQKIVASTNQLQYQAGSFSLAANQFSETGELKVESLQNAFNNNALILSGSNNQNVIWDKRGIEVSDVLNSNNKVRITSGGIFISSDGGKVWTSGITGSGINTKKLLAGTVDTNQINILSNGSYAFRWDKDGISAFREASGEFDPDKLVRFSQYGIYGTQTSRDLDSKISSATTFDEKIDFIQKNSNWSLTWDGLSLSAQDGSVSLTPIEGLQVFGPEGIFTEAVINRGYNLIKPDGLSNYQTGDMVPLLSVGKFYASNGTLETAQYGLLMRNNYGEVTLQSSNDGNLWLSNRLSVGDPLYDLGKTQETSNIVIDGTNKSIGSEPYIKGYKGWRIDSLGNAEFYNLVARGEFKATTFVYDEINAQGGSLIIAESAVTYGETLVPASGSFVLSVKNSYKGQPLLFNVNDKLRINTRLGHKLKISTTSGSNVVTTTDTTYLFQGMFLHFDTANSLNGKSITSIVSPTQFTTSEAATSTATDLEADFEGKIGLWLEVTATGTSYLEYSTYPVLIINTNNNDEFILPEALPVINYHNSDKSGYIILKADSSTNGPYIDILENGDTLTNESSHALKVRLGDLSGIVTPDFPAGTIEGYGLYTENAYLTGTIALPNVGMTNYESPTAYDDVRFWAGSDFANRETAPLIIRESGAMIFRDPLGNPVLKFDPNPDSGNQVMQIGYSAISDPPYIPPDNYSVYLSCSSNYIIDESSTVTITAMVHKNGVDITGSINAALLVWKINDTQITSGIVANTLTLDHNNINQVGNVTCSYSW